MSFDGEELYLYIKNDGDLYRRQRKPIEELLTKKNAARTYSHVRAVDAFKRLCDAGAKKYAVEFSGERKFTQIERRTCAEAFANDLEAELAIGESRTKSAAQLDREIKQACQEQRAAARRKPTLYR
jgi:hypothetical protein